MNVDEYTVRKATTASEKGMRAKTIQVQIYV